MEKTKTEKITLLVNGETYEVNVDPKTPLLYVLRNDLGLKGPRFGCGSEQCNACKVLVDKADVPSCKLPVEQVKGLPITTIEGLGTADQLHPLQETFIEEQAIQCGYCASGMIIAAQGLLNRTRYPTDDEIRTALADNLCRCGVYERVRRAIKMRIGQPVWEPIYEVVTAQKMASESDAPVKLSSSLQEQPDLDAWIRIDPDKTVTIFSGKAEIGQGIKTAVAQIAAEELDISLARIRVVTADTGQTPNEGLTAGSMSVQVSGNSIRVAAAEARHILLNLAFEEIEAKTAVDSLVVTDGTVTDPATGRQTTYWKLMGGKRFGRQVTGLVKPKNPDTYQIVGQAATRLDMVNKVTGTPSYVHDMDLPGMVHGRIVRPPAYDATLIFVDENSIRQMPGVLKIIRDGSFLAIIAEREEQAIWASEALRASAVWENETSLPTPETIYDHLLTQPAQSRLILSGTAVDDPIPPIEAPKGAASTLQATYYRPYHMHGSLGPSAAVAQMVDGKLTIWSHTQGAFMLQASIAKALKMDTTDVRVIHAEGAGCYGHNGADDAGMDAALLARAFPGWPVSLKWMRADEHTWEPYGAAMVMKMQASLDDDGRVIDWNHDVWSYPHTTRPRPTDDGTSGLIAAWHLEQPFPKPKPRLMIRSHFGSYRNADPLYAFEKRRVVTHFVADSPLRTSAMRSLGAYANVFAIESFMDELAVTAGADPIEFRLKHLDDPRAKAVIEAAAQKANWEKRMYPSNSGNGRSVAFAQYKNQQCYAAIIVDLSVDRQSGQIQLKNVIIAADSGQVVNPDGLSNQLEGGFVQAASWTLEEEVKFNQKGILSQDWDTYPILRFSSAPVIQTVIVNHPELSFLGSGEASQNPTPAAIANAVYDAVGIRLRQIPFSPERVLAALGEQG